MTIEQYSSFGLLASLVPAFAYSEHLLQYPPTLVQPRGNQHACNGVKFYWCTHDEISRFELVWNINLNTFVAFYRKHPFDRELTRQTYDQWSYEFDRHLKRKGGFNPPSNIEEWSSAFLIGIENIDRLAYATEPSLEFFDIGC